MALPLAKQLRTIRNIRTIRTTHLNLTQNYSLREVGLKQETDQTTETTLELDSHADTSVLGKDTLIFVDYDRPFIVKAYDPRLGSAEYWTVSWAVAYDDPQTGRMLLLVINQAIHIPHLDHQLLCSVQCHVNDVTVNKMPKFLALDPTETMHPLTLTDPNNLLQKVTLPLWLGGVISLLNVRTPTIDQCNDQTITRLGSLDHDVRRPGCSDDRLHQCG